MKPHTPAALCRDSILQDHLLNITELMIIHVGLLKLFLLRQCSNSHGKCEDVPNKLWIISPTRQEIRKWVTKFYAIDIKRNILALVWGGV